MPAELHRYDKTFNLTPCNYQKIVQVTYNWNDGIVTISNDTHYLDFNGWSLASLGSIDYEDRAEVKNLTTEYNGTVTLYAKWGGEIVLPIATWPGYIFLGWSKERQDPFPDMSYNTKVQVAKLRVGKLVGSTYGDDPIANVENYMRWSPEGDTTLYAMWYDNRITVTLNSNFGGENEETTILNGERNVEMDIPAKPFQRHGYEFMGWSKNRNATMSELILRDDGTSYASFDSDVVLYAIWRRNIFRVDFQLQGGQIDPSESTYVMVAEGNPLPTLPTPIRLAHDFQGWFTQPLGGYKAWNGTLVMNDMVLYAQWRETEFTV